LGGNEEPHTFKEKIIVRRRTQPLIPPKNETSVAISANLLLSKNVN